MRSVATVRTVVIVRSRYCNNDFGSYCRLDTVVTFVISSADQLMSSPVMWCKERLWDFDVLQSCPFKTYLSFLGSF
jgi:hypothetical protein